MTRLQFHILLKNYLDNKSTPEELALVESWYELLENENFTELTSEELDKVEGRLWHKIQAQTIYKDESELPAKATVIPLFWKRLAIAVTFAIVSTTAFFLYNHNTGNLSGSILKLIPKEGYKNQTNQGLSDMNIILSDSSLVTLKPGAKLYYPIVFNTSKREVYLEGVAFFSVKKNPLKPFYVYNNNIVTHVIGTSFWIKPDKKNDKVDVEVVTGRVEVYENKEMIPVDATKSNGVILLPNQKVTYNQSPRKFETTLVEKPVLLSIYNLKKFQETMVFDDSPLSHVINILQEIYGVKILLENDSIGNCPFSGDIYKLDFYNQLDVLCKSVGKTYEIKGTDILIIGNGCN